MANSLLEALSTAGVATLDNQTVLAVQNLLDSQTFQEAIPDDEDVFQCGRCKHEFTSLSSFLNHKQTPCSGISKEPGNKDTCSGDQTIITSNGGVQSFIYTTQVAQSSSMKQGGACMVPVPNYVQNVMLSDDVLSFQSNEHNLQQQNNLQFILPKSGNASFQSQIGTTFLGGDRNLLTLSVPSKLSTYCSYTVDENGCLVSSNGLSHAIGGYQIGAGPLAATAQPVVMMEEQSSAMVQVRMSSSNSLNSSSSFNKKLDELGSELPQQNYTATLCTTTIESMNDAATTRRRKLKALSSSLGDSANSVSAAQTAIKCKYCDKTFTKNFDMQQHVRSHTGEKPFQCIVCGRGFAQKSNVKKHLQTHKVWPQGLNRTLSDQVTLVEDVTMNEKQDLILTSKSQNIVTTTIDRISDVINNPSVSLNSNEADCDTVDNGFHIIVEKESSDEQPIRAVIYMQKEDDSGMTAVDSEDPSTLHERRRSSKSIDTRQIKMIIDNSYLCQYCGNKFTTYFQYKSHMVIHKDEQVYKCVMKSCCESFRELDAFLDHIKQHQNELSYRCHLCNKQLPSLEELANHQYTHALFPKQGLKPGPKYFRCVKCNSKYASPEALQHHLSTVSHDYHCLQPDCPKVFTCERYLRRHLATHGAFDEFLCSVCNKPFKTEQYLKMHMLIHSSEKPFQCNTCKKSFNRKDKLKRHMVIHEPVKRFKCPLFSHTGCTKAFNRADKLKAHLLSHSGAKPFCCRTCDRAFTRRAHLHEHERVHTKSYKFSCKLCGQGFLRRKPYQRHVCSVQKESGQAGHLSKATNEGQLLNASPRRGRPPKKSTISTASSSVAVDAAVESVKLEPSSIGVTVSGEDMVVGRSPGGSGLGLGRLNTTPGNVYIFHPLVDDAGGQQFAFQTFKLLERPAADADDMISEANNLANLFCSESDATNTTKDVS